MTAEEIEQNFWTQPFGFNNQNTLYQPAGTTIQYDWKTESQQQFLLEQFIGRLELASGSDELREKVLIQMQIRDRLEDLFDLEVTFDELFGSPQFPHQFYTRFISKITQIVITVTNNSGVDINYDWLLWGTKIFLDRPCNKRKLIKDVFAIPRQGTLSWNQNISGDKFSGGVIAVPAGSASGPYEMTCDSIQGSFPFLARNIIAKQKPVNIRFQLYSKVDNQYLFSYPALLRLIAGDAGRPFMFPQYIPINRYDQIQMKVVNYELTPQTIPFRLWGLKSDSDKEFILGDYVRQRQ